MWGDETGLCVAKGQEGEEGNGGRDEESVKGMGGEAIGKEGDEAAEEVGTTDGDGGEDGTVGIWTFEVKLKFHHKVNPFIRVLT